MTKVRQLTRQQGGLIETSFTFAFRVERHRDDQVGAVERLAPLQLKHQLRRPASNVWFSFQVQDRSSQSSFIQATGARIRESVIVTPAAADTCQLLLINQSGSKSPALPA